jgi:hypothetical protein
MRASLFFILVLTFLSILKADETGYVNKISITQEDTLKLYISTSVNPFSIQIYKYNDVDSLVTTISTIPGGLQSYPDSSYYYGCNWPVSYSLVIPISWLPGVYYAQFPTSVGSKLVLFMVSPKVRGSYSKILYLASANTWEAYNPIGGKSLYTFNSTDTIASYKVSFQRPGRAYTGYPEFSLELPFVRWLYRNHINVECAVNYDIHSDSSLLSIYKVMVIDGHSEYWSSPEKTETQNFVTNGGNLIILSGNTCWWQVRYENNGNTIVCYKDPTVDPYTGVIDSLVTYNWHLSPVNSPENYMTGLSYLGAGYVNDGSILPASAGYGGYTVYNHHSWVYNGTGLMEGEDLGYSDAIVGDETDGGLFNFVNGIPAFTGTDGSPTNFMVLGLSPAYSTWGFNPIPRATFGIFHKQGGGTVFNAATNNWSLGLDSNYYVQKITKNVFDKFTANKFPPDIVSWTPFNVETDFIQSENIPLNKRNFLRVDTSTVNLSVNAVDPYNGTISYQWLLNNLPAGNSSTLSINNSQFSSLNKVNKIKALVYNSFDTSAISWNYFNTQLAVYSDPVTDVNINSTYLYRINIFNSYNDSLTITAPGAPSWLSVTSDGELKGTAPAAMGVFPITIIVTNNHAQADTQLYVLNVNDPNFILPVELVSFSGSYANNSVSLKWQTATESNNFGFCLERSSDKISWAEIGFINGSGNSNSTKYYTYADKNVSGSGTYYYRLKQTDKDGQFKYLNTINIDIKNIPTSYALAQNFPNPFNPSTRIRYALPAESNVTITIYNVIGEKVKELSQGVQPGGNYELNFNASGLSSGVYFYTLHGISIDGKQNFLNTKKMIVMK